MATLIELTENPELHKLLLGEYAGAYSLGVGMHKCLEMLVLQVESLDTLKLQQGMQIISFEGMPVLLRVELGFSPPQPLTACCG